MRLANLRIPKVGTFWHLAEIISMVIVLAPIIYLSYLVLVISIFGGVEAETYNVEAYAEQISPDTISVTYLGGDDEWKVSHIGVVIDGFFYPEGASEGNLSYQYAFGGNGIDSISPGKTITITDTSGSHITERQDHVKVFAEFLDGTVMCLVDEQL